MNKPTGLHILIRNSAGGDEQAQADLYKTVYQPLFQHVLNRFSPALNQEDEIARNQALKWLRTLNKTVSIWETQTDATEKDETALFDVLFLRQSAYSPEDTLEEQVLSQLIWETAQKSLSDLSEREREIISMRYERNLTLEEIGQQFHVKRPRVHQVLAAIHHKLRKGAKLDEL